MSYLYSLPTTGSVKWAAVVSDPSHAHSADLARATAARGRVRAVLKETRRIDAANKDWLGCATALQDYLPHLLAIIRCTETDSLILRGQPVFSWRSTLSAASLKSGRLALPSLQYELAFVLFTYGLALSNHATAIVQALGPYERDLGVSEAERKRGDEQVNSAADTLCRAAGVFKYLAEVIIPEWEAGPSDTRGRPPELTRELVSALSKLCLADAEKLAIRRLMSKSVAVAQATITPGPPLPRSHPSPSLLAKLYLNVYQLYDTSRSLAKSVGNGSTSGEKRNLLASMKRDKAPSSTEDDSTDSIAQALRTYLSDGRAFSSSLSYKWLGVDAGENSQKLGEAIAWLTLARQGLLGLQGRSKIVFPLKKGKVERSKRKDRLVEELEDIDGFLKAYKRTNDTVLFQPVPSESTLLAQVPGGRSVLLLKPYSLPQQAFTSRRQTENAAAEAALAAQAASLSIQDDADSDSDASELDQPTQQSNYF